MFSYYCLVVEGVHVCLSSISQTFLVLSGEREVAVIPALATVEVPAPTAAARWQSW